ncbi:MAG: undecaprenyl-diphosphate phosphatase [bacterium]
MGIVQGITEFLPISSSGHLVVLQGLLGFREPQLAFDVMVHLGTLLAVITFFRRSLVGMVASIFVPSLRRSEEWNLLKMVIIGTIPTVFIGAIFKDPLEELFASPSAVGFFWLMTGLLLFMADRWLWNGKDLSRGTLQDALAVGFFQGLAIIPGVSRSGATISMGIFRQFSGANAARFSFILSVPAVLGATVLEARKITSVAKDELLIFISGAAVAAIVGYLAIALLIRLIRARRLAIFSYYCFAAGILTLTALLVTGKF